jgi:transcriptional regulator GlxA family with amidase domain
MAESGPTGQGLNPWPRRGAAAKEKAHPVGADLCQAPFGLASDFAELAKVAHLSPRQFSRAFSLETGQPPAKAIENLRVDTAPSMTRSSRRAWQATSAARRTVSRAKVSTSSPRLRDRIEAWSRCAARRACAPSAS